MDIIEGLRKDLNLLLNQRVVIRLKDNEESTGQLMVVGESLATMFDENAQRTVRLRLDMIKSVDDPPEPASEETQLD